MEDFTDADEAAMLLNLKMSTEIPEIERSADRDRVRENFHYEDISSDFDNGNGTLKAKVRFFCLFNLNVTFNPGMIFIFY